MKVLAVKSIPLSKETIESWKTLDNEQFQLKFLKRSRHPNEALRILQQNNYSLILNLGNSELTDEEEIVWNSKSVCDTLRTPGSMRKSPLDAILPPIADWNDPNVWIKGPGRGGWNKTHHLTGLDDNPVPITRDWDCQKHIEGTEYRVLTVGPRVVQSSERLDSNGERQYGWVGLKNTPKGVKEICRYAASLLPNQRTLIGWDVIANDKAVFVLEGNTSPGLNKETAERIRNELIRQWEEARPYEPTITSYLSDL
jgi:hypothetical protein